MSVVDRTRLERIRHWQGETLRSADLNDQLAFDAQKRWWHNRLHGAFGVAAGLGVSPLTDQDGNQVFEDDLPVFRVQPGLAYDCHGRELLLLHEATTRLPEESREGGVWNLLAVHRANFEFPPPARQPLSARSALQEAELVWKPVRRGEPLPGVPLAEAAVNEDGVFELLPDLRPTPIRPQARPLVGNGFTVAGRTAWREWGFRSVFVPNLDALRLRFLNSQLGAVITGRRSLGVEVTVDTSAVGFTETPCYFAWLQGDWLSRRLKQGFVPLVFDRILQTTPRSFLFSLLVPETPADGLPSFLSFARSQLYVCWLGIQMRRRAAVQTAEVNHGDS